MRKSERELNYTSSNPRKVLYSCGKGHINIQIQYNMQGMVR